MGLGASGAPAGEDHCWSWLLQGDELRSSLENVGSWVVQRELEGAREDMPGHGTSWMGARVGSQEGWAMVGMALMCKLPSMGQECPGGHTDLGVAWCLGLWLREGNRC